MKNLCIIGTSGDSQVNNWIAIAKRINSKVAFFDVQEMGENWRIEVNNEFCGLFVPPAGFYSFSSDCWYFRGPLQAKHITLVQLHLIHALLSFQALPRGDYFNPDRIEANLLSKPYQQIFFRESFPQSRILSADKILEADSASVIKSISHIRSKASMLRDILEYNKSIKFLAGPVLVQERVAGTPVKVHCYISRNGSPLFLACGCSSSEVDYRYAKTNYFEYEVSCDIKSQAQRIHSITRSHFFDFDIMCSEGLEPVLLEVNFSPAPSYYELKLHNNFKFSEAILRDWLSWN